MRIHVSGNLSGAAIASPTLDEGHVFPRFA
jgi:hypothetical protein